MPCFYLNPKQDDFNQELQVCVAEAVYCLTLLRLNNIQIKRVQHVGKLIDSEIEGMADAVEILLAIILLRVEHVHSARPQNLALTPCCSLGNSLDRCVRRAANQSVQFYVLFKVSFIE